MKNAIVTWFHYENYGTNLQAYALQKFLNDRNKETNIINYIPTYIHEKEKKKITYENICIFIKNRKNELLKKIIKIKYNKEFKEKSRKFKKFIEININLTKKQYEKEELEELNNSYDNFIVGSDQIWNPNNVDDTFFLKFVKNNKNKISYAPSFGVNKLEESLKSNIKEDLEKFRYLSVREETGKNIVKELIGKEPLVVLDPTLLLLKEEWIRLIEKKNEPKYILCYFLGNQKYYWKYVKRLQKETGYNVKIIPIKEEDFFRKGDLQIEVGPTEFVELIANAEVVCTDSFHGTIFSIIMEKDFSVLKRFKDNDKKSQNSRIYNLLSMLKLDNHLIDVNSEILRYKVDNYNNVQEILNKNREESINFLMNAIERR